MTNCLLTSLERSVLEQIYKNCSNPAGLKSQIDASKVLKRKNTGAGFYTYLKTSSSITLPEKHIGNVFADVDGCTNPMTFVLFLQHGLLHFLEGAAVDDNTKNTDFSSARFQIRDT